MDILTKILSASVELFRQYGFKTITMDDIARRAGISKKTLYQHFANKSEVIKESVGWYRSKIYGSCVDTINESQNAIEAMSKIIEMLDQMHKHTNPMVILELQRFYPEAYDSFREGLISQDVELIRKNIVQGIEEGLYRPEVNAELLAKLRIESSLLMFQPNLLVSERHDFMYVVHEITEHFLYGLMTPKGEKLYLKYKEKYQKQVTKA